MMNTVNSDYGLADGAMASAADSETRTNLIVNYLPQGLSDHDLYKMFIVVGAIKSCRVMKDLKTGYSYGFGFVEYQKAEDAAKAISQLSNLAVQHKRIKVSYARPPGEDIKDSNLYIQNIPRSYTVDHLQNLFSQFGNIVQKSLLKDKVTGLPRGVGFIRYDKKSEAEAAISGMNGVTPADGTEPLVVRIAEEHGKARGTMGGGGGGMFPHPPFGRGNYSNNGGPYGRGNYNNTGGKMLPGRMNKRFNPIGGGGVYGSGAYPYHQDIHPPPPHFRFSSQTLSSGSYTSF